MGLRVARGMIRMDVPMLVQDPEYAIDIHATFHDVSHQPPPSDLVLAVWYDKRE